MECEVTRVSDKRLFTRFCSRRPSAFHRFASSAQTLIVTSKADGQMEKMTDDEEMFKQHLISTDFNSPGEEHMKVT